MPGPVWRFGLPLLTLLVLGWLGFWHTVVLVEMAAGEPSLDVRWQGYDLAQVAQYLTMLTDEGRAFYQGPVRLLDSVLPVLLAWTLLLPLRMGGKLLSWLALPALLGMAFDLVENFAVGRILRDYVPGGLPSETMVIWASAMTMAKFACFGVALVIALGAMVAQGTK